MSAARTLLVLVIAASAVAFLDAPGREPASQSGRATTEPQLHTIGAESIGAALRQLARVSGSTLSFQHTESAAFVLVVRATDAVVVRVSAYPLDVESHARLGELWNAFGQPIDPYREPIGEVVFYELPVERSAPGDSAEATAADLVRRIFDDVFELSLGYELFVERVAPAR